MFKGRYNYSVDEKGRVSFPARFRDSIVSGEEDRVVLTTALDSAFSHLDVYPWERWAEFEEKLAAKPRFDSNVILLKRLYVANAVECSLDRHGRILVPGNLRGVAGIVGEATWVGMNQIVELWSPGLWEQAQSDALARMGDVQSGLSDFDL